METVLFLIVLFLAYANGANDNSKGVATLYGSGTIGYKPAIALGTAATFAGSMLSLLLARELISAFSGERLVPEGVIGNGSFLPAAGLGAAATVMLAVRLGLPVSTTHGLVGGLLGAGWMAVGGEVNASRLGGMFFAPLLLSPLAAFALVGVVYPFFGFLRKRLHITKESCICIGGRRVLHPAASLPDDRGVYSTAETGLSVEFGEAAECRSFYSGRFLGISTHKLLDALHVFSALSVSFARGLNDAPKIAALLLASSFAGIHWNLTAVAVAMAAGGLSARRVAKTVSRRITPLDHGQGLSANLVTALLVISASRYGVPVSTTHVSVGAISAVGAIAGRANAGMIRSIVLAWLITLPLATAVSAFFYWILAG